ncbi:MAG: cysteine hydrolase family protein [Anaerovoracaceae bacterium]
MENILVVVDMQNDFIDGSLGTAEAQKIVGNVKEKIKNFDGKIYFTRDTHGRDYLETSEGRKLPVEHCIKDTEGWQIRAGLVEAAEGRLADIIDKPSFGSVELAESLKRREKETGEVTFVGLCTDICVISNVLLAKAYMPETKLVVDASCCAGVTPESHENALEAMKMCQIDVI